MILPEYIKYKANFSAETEEELGGLFQRNVYSKSSMLFSHGDNCKHVYYIEKGLARVFYYNESGKEVIVWFVADQSFVTGIDSFYQHQSTRLYCELLEDSVVYSINYNDFDAMLSKSIELARFAFHVAYDIAGRMNEFLINFKFQSAEERYQALLQAYPTIVNRASLGHIASYLGITQETLSRIRATAKKS